MTEYPYDKDQMPIVLPHRYDEGLNLDKSRVVHIPENQIGEGLPYGRVPVQVIPELRLTMHEIQNEFKITSQRDLYSTFIVDGLSIFQHRYHPDLRRVKSFRRTDFFSGTKMAELVDTFGTCEHFFERVKGGKKEVKVVGHRNHTIAAISDNAEFFNLSSSDMTQVIIIHYVVLWDKLPADFRKFFEDVISKFEKHAREFCTESTSIHYTSIVGQSIGESDNRTIGESDNMEDKDYASIPLKDGLSSVVRTSTLPDRKEQP